MEMATSTWNSKDEYYVGISVAALKGLTDASSRDVVKLGETRRVLIVIYRTYHYGHGNMLYRDMFTNALKLAIFIDWGFLVSAFFQKGQGIHVPCFLFFHSLRAVDLKGTMDVEMYVGKGPARPALRSLPISSLNCGTPFPHFLN